MFNWDDIQVFLAVERSGSLPEAAKTLKIAHSTAFRRLNAFEETLGVKLFDRLPNGMVLTAEGARIIDFARDVEHRTEEIERAIAGADYALKGMVRVTTTHGLSLQFMKPVFHGFQLKNPDIQLEVQWGDQARKLSRHESDVIILPSKKPPENAYGRKVCQLAFGLFASKSFIKKYGIPESCDDLSGFQVVALDEGFVAQPFYDYFKKATKQSHKNIVCSSFLTIREAVASDMGIGLLPHYYGADYKNLISICPRVEGVDQDLWILTHRDLRNTVRIRAFMDYAYDEISRLKPQLEAFSAVSV